MYAANMPHILLDFLSPERCVLCGNYITFKNRAGPYPLCGNCADSFVPEEGPRCGLCSMPLVSETGKCLECRGRSVSFNGNYSLFLYADPKTARCVTAYKGQGFTGLGSFFCGFLAEAYFNRYRDAPLVPVPPRTASLRRRGFDHVLLLCRRLRRGYGIPYLRLLRRRGKTREQKTLNREEREENLRGHIVPRRWAGEGVPETVVLLDDVFTTGATADECSRALKSMGAEKVFVLTLAID